MGKVVIDDVEYISSPLSCGLGGQWGLHKELEGRPHPEANVVRAAGVDPHPLVVFRVRIRRILIEAWVKSNCVPQQMISVYFLRQKVDLSVSFGHKTKPLIES